MPLVHLNLFGIILFYFEPRYIHVMQFIPYSLVCDYNLLTIRNRMLNHRWLVLIGPRLLVVVLVFSICEIS